MSFSKIQFIETSGVLKKPCKPISTKKPKEFSSQNLSMSKMYFMWPIRFRISFAMTEGSQGKKSISMEVLEGSHMSMDI